jgi:hypothetical protein
VDSDGITAKILEDDQRSRREWAFGQDQHDIDPAPIAALSKPDGQLLHPGSARDAVSGERRAR